MSKTVVFFIMIELSAESPNTSKSNIILSWWQKKTHLEKQLISGFVAVTVITFAFLIDAAVHSQKEGKGECETTQCITSASNLLNQMDETVDPCDDFFKFACGTMSERTHSKNIPLTSFLYQLRKQMIHLLTEPQNPKDHPYFNFEKALFVECINESKDGTSLKTLKSILVELGGWPLLGESKWNKTNFNWVDLIGKLKDKGLIHKLLLNVNFQEESLENTIINLIEVNILYLDPDTYTPSYKNLMIETAVALGVEEDTAIEEMTKVYNFSVNLNQLIRYNGRENRTRLLFSELQSNYKEINWEKFINLNLEPLHTVLQSDYIEFQYPTFLKQFFSLLNATNLSTLVNYIFWFAIADILPLISNQALDISNQFYCISTIPTRNPVEECGETIFRIVNLNPLKIAYAERYTPDSARKRIKIMLDFIVNEFKKMISKDSWVDEETIIKTYNWLENFKYIIGIESDAKGNLEAEIPKSIRTNDPFLTRFLQIRKERNYQNLLEIKYKNETTDYYAHFHTLSGLLITPTLDTLMFPPSLLQGSYFDKSRPMYMNFGVLGTTISSIFVSFYTSEVINRNIWSHEVRETFKQKTDCIKHNLERFGGDGVLTKEKKRYYINSKIAKIVGLKLAYNAYKSWTNENGKEPNLIGLNYTDTQLFWISSFSHYCFQDDENTWSNYYNDSEIVRQNFNFAIDFNCDLDSNMNPSNKCVVFYKVFYHFFINVNSSFCFLNDLHFIPIRTIVCVHII